jgi:ATP-binding cassette subfamily G (WHITE) protein 2
MQDDCQYTTLTVREALWFTCALRLPASTRRAERIARIEETMEDVSLTPFADTRIGDDVTGGLSGGQRRRVTIAVELIGRPQLIFLDEPTSGLDAYGAQQARLPSLLLLPTPACTLHNPEPTARAPRYPAPDEYPMGAF